MKNSIDTIGNRTRDLPIYSAVPQTTVPPRAPAFPKHQVYLRAMFETKNKVIQAKDCVFRFRNPCSK